MKNYPSASLTIRAKEGMSINLDIADGRLALRYRCIVSSTTDDIMFMTNSVVSTLSGETMPGKSSECRLPSSALQREGFRLSRK